MPIKNTDKVSRSRYNPGPDVLSLMFPYHKRLELHGSHNGSLRIERTPDGGAEISARDDIHAWGNDQTIRLDADAWKVVQAFVAGGEGGSYITPHRETMMRESVRKMLKND